MKWYRTVVLTIFCSMVCFIVPVYGQMDKRRVSFLKAVPRFNSTTHQDYYFVCDTCNTALFWNVSGSLKGGYDMNSSVGDVRSSSNGDATAINDVSILLSSRTYDGATCLTSLLIVSASNTSQPSVQCVCNSTNEDITYMAKRQDVINMNNTEDGIISIEYAFKHDKVVLNSYESNSFFTNHLVLCKVRASFQSWEVDNVKVGNLTSADIVSTTRFIVSDNVATRAVVLLAKMQSELTSILIWTGNYSTDAITIRCLGDMQELSYRITREVIETTNDATPVQSTENDSTGPTTSSSMNGPYILVLVFLFTALLFYLMN